MAAPICVAGIVTGIATAVFLMLSGRNPYMGLNAGFIALCFNFSVTALVSLLTTVRVAGFEETLPALAASPAGDGATIA